MFPSRPIPRAHRPRHGRRPLAAVAAVAAAGAIAVLATSCAGATGASPAPPPSVPNPEASDAALTEQDVNAWLDGILPASMDQAQMAGAAVSVVSDGELLTARGYGYSDVEAQEPVDPEETLFRVASVTKTFTATAVMQMVEGGDLDLDTDVDEYLDFEVDKAYDEDLTLRHLLSHTGGFEERVANAMLADGEEVDLRSVVADDPPEQVSEPGTAPAYSNYGIALAGYIIENTSGIPFHEYVEEKVLAPAGMDSSSLGQPLPEELESRLSEGYTTDEEPPTDRFEIVSDSPAGALTSSVTDMAEFMRVHMEASEGAGVLEPETVVQMHEPALGEESLGGLAAGAQMGLGFFQEERNGNRVVSHGGDTDVFHSEMQIYPEENAGIFITLNSSGNDDLASHSLRLALAEGFADRYFPGEQADGGEVEPTAAEHAAMMEGSYMSSRSIQSNFASILYAMEETQVVATEDDTIVLTSPETGQPTEYIEVEPWVWREIDGHRTLAVDVVDNEVEAIGTTAFTFLPVDEETQASVVLPVAIGSVAVIVIAILSWPVAAFVRWRMSLPERDKAGRWARILTRAAMVATLLGFGGWALALSIATNFEPVSFGMLRVFQFVQGLGVLGIFPAAYVLYDNIRRGEGWGRYVGSSLVLLALLGTGWIATVFGMVVGSVSF